MDLIEMDLIEWYPLSHDVVDFAVEERIGAYTLSKSSNGLFQEVHYVGRDDDDLHRRLGEHADDDAYSYFQFAYVDTVKDGFELECRLYHNHKPVDNKIHPAVPDGTSYRCPDVFCPRSKLSAR